MSVRAKNDSAKAVGGIGRESQEPGGGRNIPNGRGEIAAADGEACAVGAESQGGGNFASGKAHVSRAVLVFVQARAVPDSQWTILACAHEISSIRAEDEVKHITVMFSEDADLRPVAASQTLSLLS